MTTRGLPDDPPQDARPPVASGAVSTDAAPARSDMPVGHGSVGLVPAYWGDAPDRDFRATLTFRIGEADERLRTRGRCHLVRALVLDDLDVTGVEIDVAITTLATRFEVTGDDRAVARTLTAIARRLSALRVDRAEGLIPELLAAWRPPAEWDTQLISLRFGSRGYGLPALPLLGLHDFDRVAFDDWVRTWFTGQNAVFSSNRRPPADLDLSALGDGIRKPLPEPHQVEHALPGLATGPPGRLSVSFLGRFDGRSMLLLDLAVHRTHARCLQIDERVPRPVSVARRTGPGLATISLSITASDDVIPALRDAIASDLFHLSMNGPRDDELERARAGARRSRESPVAGRSVGVDEAAAEDLFGESLDMAGALEASPAEFAEIVRVGLSGAIWQLPGAVSTTDHRLVPISWGRSEVIEGERFTPLDHPGSGPGDGSLIVSPGAVTVADSSGTSTTIAFADTVAMEILPDGRRVLWSVDGPRIVVDPSSWERGEAITAALDARIDPWVVLHTDRPV